MYGWHAKKYENKVGMMHGSKGQHIGKAPALHLFTFLMFLFSCIFRIVHVQELYHSHSVKASHLFKSMVVGSCFIKVCAAFYSLQLQPRTERSNVSNMPDLHTTLSIPDLGTMHTYIKGA